LYVNVKNIPIGVAPKQPILNSNNALVGEMSAKVVTKASYNTEIGNRNFNVAATHPTGLSSSQTLAFALPIFPGLIGM
jgi:hypothetical protein